MVSFAATLDRLRHIPDLRLKQEEPLSRHTRFAIGGPARAYIECASESALCAAMLSLDAVSPVIIGGGTNLVVSDDGFDGVILRSTASSIEISGATVRVEAGADLQTLVDSTIAAGLRGLETMTGIPGSVGGAVYGNAGAYGHSICERITSVRFLDRGAVRVFGNAECQFHYRESAFKRHKDWIVLSTELALEAADSAELRLRADKIRAIRDQKYPPAMRCAGSIFKNLILSELDPAVASRVPADVVREGKVPSAWFLEQVGAKGMADGDVRVADYHANLIYNDGHGTAAQVRNIIRELKRRVADE